MTVTANINKATQIHTTKMIMDSHTTTTTKAMPTTTKESIHKANTLKERMDTMMNRAFSKPISID
jgi:hypothetical protein